MVDKKAWLLSLPIGLFLFALLGAPATPTAGTHSDWRPPPASARSADVAQPADLDDGFSAAHPTRLAPRRSDRRLPFDRYAVRDERSTVPHPPAPTLHRRLFPPDGDDVPAH